MLQSHRYYHPSPPTRTVKQERSFEGISLETPGSSSKSVLQMSRFQLCHDCYGAASDAASVVRVPSLPSRLLQQWGLPDQLHMPAVVGGCKLCPQSCIGHALGSDS